MELNQVHRALTVGLTETVKSSTGYRIQFEHKHEHNTPEKVSLTHLAKNFQKQVRIEDVTHQTKTAIDTAPTSENKMKEKCKMKQV